MKYVHPLLYLFLPVEQGEPEPNIPPFHARIDIFTQFL